MRHRKLTLRQVLLLLAMALVGCTQQYPCMVVMPYPNWVSEEITVHGDSLNMISPFEVVVWRDGTAMTLHGQLYPLVVHCESTKTLWP